MWLEGIKSQSVPKNPSFGFSPEHLLPISGATCYILLKLQGESWDEAPVLPFPLDILLGSRWEYLSAPSQSLERHKGPEHNQTEKFWFPVSMYVNNGGIQEMPDIQNNLSSSCSSSLALFHKTKAMSSSRFGNSLHYWTSFIWNLDTSK